MTRWTPARAEMRYSHLSPDVRKDAVRLLDADPPDNGLDFDRK
jgi:hypothetical protein